MPKKSEIYGTMSLKCHLCESCQCRGKERRMLFHEKSPHLSRKLILICLPEYTLHSIALYIHFATSGTFLQQLCLSGFAGAAELKHQQPVHLLATTAGGTNKT